MLNLNFGWIDLPHFRNVPGEVDDPRGVVALVNKVLRKGTKGKELNPKYFDVVEADDFLEADADQWQTHIRTGAVRILSASDPRSVDPSRSLRLPPRFASTNKNEKNPELDELKAKSRLVVPGHVAPQGEVRSDAPVTPQQSLHFTWGTAANNSWWLGTFDVQNAFLSGKENLRKLYVRPPREGIRGVPQDSLIEIMKGVFGLRESPRLWWLQLRECVCVCAVGRLLQVSIQSGDIRAA